MITMNMITSFQSSPIQTIPLLLTFLLFIFMIFKLLLKSKSPNPSPKLPPGPTTLPIIGNLHQLMGSLPHRCLNNLAKIHGPIMKIQMGEVMAIVISSPQTAKQILKTQELNFAQRPLFAALPDDYSGLIFSPHNDYWRRMRKICALELLAVKRVNSFRYIRLEEVKNLIESISSSIETEINLSQKIKSYANNVTSRAAFGNKCKNQNEFLSAIEEASALLGGFHLADLYPSLKFLSYLSGFNTVANQLEKKLCAIVEGIIDDHKMKRRKAIEDEELPDEEDLVDAFLNLQESGRGEKFQISTTDIIHVTLEMFAAGSDALSTSIEWAILEMMKNPEVLKKAQSEVRQKLQEKTEIQESDIEDLNYLKAIIKEALRLHPPTPLIPRESLEKCEINGYQILEKTKIIINSWAIGRHEEYWKNGDCFQPERFIDYNAGFVGTNFEYIPFGGGRRICPGFSFAFPSIEILLANLLYHFDWKLPNGMKPEEIHMNETFGITCRRSSDLYLIPLPFIFPQK